MSLCGCRRSRCGPVEGGLDAGPTVRRMRRLRVNALRHGDELIHPLKETLFASRGAKLKTRSCACCARSSCLAARAQRRSVAVHEQRKTAQVLAPPGIPKVAQDILEMEFAWRSAHVALQHMPSDEILPSPASLKGFRARRPSGHESCRCASRYSKVEALESSPLTITDRKTRLRRRRLALHLRSRCSAVEMPMVTGIPSASRLAGALDSAFQRQRLLQMNAIRTGTDSRSQPAAEQARPCKLA
jgi:hypothetical protein